jgi:hypothetical protein
MEYRSIIIQQTKNWVKQVVIGLNFCPFANKVVSQQAVRYVVSSDTEIKKCINLLIKECYFLNKHSSTSTTLIIFCNAFTNFDEYLKLVKQAEVAIKKNSFEGIYQVASFHPNYCFADADENDAANYTNRSPYPMLHIIREEEIDEAIDKYPNADEIPERNIQLARTKGVVAMQKLLADCLHF